MYHLVVYWPIYSKKLISIVDPLKVPFRLTGHIYLPWAIFEGTLVIVYQKNAPLGYKIICSESESRKFDCQWTLVSFLVKHNQFYREAKLICSLYRSTEDICIDICVYQRVFNVWHILKQVCQCNNILNNLWENKEELNWSLLDIR